MKLPFTTPVSIESPLPVDEVFRRVAAITAPPMAIFKSRQEFPLSGRVLARAIAVSYRSFYRNSFRRELQLTLQPVSTGTRLEGRLAMRAYAYVFATIWCGIVAIFALITGIGLLVQKGAERQPWMILLPIGMLVFYYLIVRFGLWLSGRTEPKMIEVVLQVVGGRVVPNKDSRLEGNQSYPDGVL